ncbi:MAG: hypothetical protein ACE147_09865 [Candidatus Methylomirabilales bacterium]
MAVRLPILALRGARGRAGLFCALLLAGCAAVPPPRAEVLIRPAPQGLRGHQLVGETISTSLGGVATTVRWLSPRAATAYYATRPGLTAPWPEEIWREAPPTLFLLRFRNQTREEVQFDPALALLVTQEGKRERPIPYEELYMRLSGTEGDQARLRSLQATLFSRFVVLQPGGQREGLLAFPVLDAKAKHLILELGSFFVGGRIVPGHFEFQVLREPPKN